MTMTKSTRIPLCLALAAIPAVMLGLSPGPPPRLAAQVDRTRRTLATVPAELRDYVAAGLEDGHQWAGEVAGALQAARDAELRWLTSERIFLLPLYCRCR